MSTHACMPANNSSGRLTLMPTPSLTAALPLRMPQVAVVQSLALLFLMEAATCWRWWDLPPAKGAQGW